MSAAPILVVYCALIFLASLAGGWLLLALHLTHARLQAAVSLVSGLMLGMALLHFIPHAVHQNKSLELTIQCVLGGFLAMFFLERFFPHHHHELAHTAAADPDAPGPLSTADADAPHHSSHDELLEGHASSQLSWAATTVGMSFHSVLGGVALAAAIAAEAGKLTAAVGLGTALVIILHKPFDALTVSTMMTASGCSRRLRHLLNVLFALVTPAGALLFFVGASHFFGTNSSFVGSALAFSAGTFLCISCADLLPELQFHSHDRIKLSAALLAGLLIAFLVGRLDEAGHGEHSGLGRHEACSQIASVYYLEK